MAHRSCIGGDGREETHLADNLVRPPGVVAQAGDAVSDVKVPAHVCQYTPRKRVRDAYRAILRGLPLLRHSSSPSTCASLSMRSASLLIRRERSKPETFLPQAVFSASRAAATAASMSFAEPVRRYQGAVHKNDEEESEGKIPVAIINMFAEDEKQVVSIESPRTARALHCSRERVPYVDQSIDSRARREAVHNFAGSCGKPRVIQRH